jgi:hypothetical protein
MVVHACSVPQPTAPPRHSTCSLPSRIERLIILSIGVRCQNPLCSLRRGSRQPLCVIMPFGRERPTRIKGRAQAVTGLTVTFLQTYTKPKHHWDAYSQAPGNPGMYYNNIWMKVPLASMKGRPRAAPGHKATHFCPFLDPKA